MTIMTEEANKSAVESDGTEELQLGVSRAQKLMNECVKFRLSVSEFSSSKGFDSATKEEVAAATGMRKEAVGGTKKLYDPNCEPIKNARAALTAAKCLVEGMTIPLSHFRAGGGKDAGSKLLEITKADGLNDELEVHKVLIQAAEDRLNAERNVILEASRKMLTTTKEDPNTGESVIKTKFNLDDYPETFKLSIDWHTEPALLPEYMATIMPKAFQRAMDKAEETFEKTAQDSVEEFLNEFTGVVRHWTRSLGPKIKIYPAVDHTLHTLFYGAEILKKQTCEDDPAIPQGMVSCLLLPKDSKKKSDASYTPPMTSVEYADLRPDEDLISKKTFQTSTIQNLMDVVKKFRSVGKLLGAPAGAEEAINRISTHLAGLGGSKDVAQELRNSTTYRKQTVELMENLGTSLDAEIIEVTKRRRKITPIKG